MRTLTVATIAVVTVSALAGCGENAEETEPSAPLTTITDVATDTASPSPTESESETPEGPEPLASVTYADGDITPKPGVVEAPLGERIIVEVTSDVAEEVHVHGYDEFAELKPGKAARIEFQADIPGEFAVELEDSAKLLFNLRVQ